ncbi:hypothetical protein BD410DRAFT_834344 [Rickenella mellea]|uniref:Uncharacterized protein n=1 Tax=Rickenella mellea TaxID=50990 RepID=A0A4R5XI56_9AGAM|nr:hypothetical protein BD410DRAFT_834344 [Rickenella mellea]
MNLPVQKSIKAINNAIAILSCTDIGNQFFDGKLFAAFSSTSIPTPDPQSETGFQLLYWKLRDLKSARDAVRSLLEVFDGRIVGLQKECNSLTLKYRFSSLPEDILQSIFEVGSTPDRNGCRFSVLVSHVCWRFREVTFRTPRMWNVIHDGQPMDQITTFLSRSKAVGICVFVGDVWALKSEFRRTSIEKFMDIVIRHNQCWSTFACYVGVSEDEGMHRFLAYPGLALPNLITLSCSRMSSIDPAELDLFSSWVIPRLSHFNGLNVTLQPSIMGENLVSCQLDFDGVDGDDDWSSTGVLHALSSTRSLKELRLKFENILSEHISTNMPTTSISSLETFHISFIDCNTSNLIQLMFALRMHNVSHLSVTFAFRNVGHEDSETLLDSVLPSSGHYPKLSSFDLTVLDAQLYHPSLLVFLAQRVPSSVKLSMQGIVFGPYSSKPWKSCPVSWASININLCDALSYKHIDLIIDTVKQSGKWDDFQTLKVSNCRGLSLSYLKDLKASIGDKLDYQLEYKL